MRGIGSRELQMGGGGGNGAQSKTKICQQKPAGL
jgi:hypothetical protein